MLNNIFGIYQAYSYLNVTSTALWIALQATNSSSAHFAAQTDRNLVVYASNGTAIWNTGTTNGGAGGPFCLKMLNDGNLIWTNSTSNIIWQSNTTVSMG